MTQKKRYAVVGLGHRSQMYTDALYNQFKDYGTIVAYCDTNQTRMEYYNNLYQQLYNAQPVPTYKAEDFERMIKEQAVDAVIVTSIDRTHNYYIVRAMQLGCD